MEDVWTILFYINFLTFIFQYLAEGAVFKSKISLATPSLRKSSTGVGTAWRLDKLLTMSNVTWLTCLSSVGGIVGAVGTRSHVPPHTPPSFITGYLWPSTSSSLPDPGTGRGVGHAINTARSVSGRQKLSQEWTDASSCSSRHGCIHNPTYHKRWI